MRIKILVFWAALVTACSEPSRVADHQNLLEQDSAEIIATPSMEEPSDASLLLEHRVMHAFSRPDAEDEFYLGIKGQSLLEGTVIFKITGSDGATLLNEEFPSGLLMNYGFEGDMNAVKEKEAYIKDRVRDFFHESNFLYPAISPEEVFDGDYSDEAIWREVQSDRSSIGFLYLIGVEDVRKIAYSTDRKKAAMYFNCCL